MVMDVKYYIITIASIFISLGIGIFIGFNLDGEEIYLKQQQQLVDSLEDRFTELKLESKGLYQVIEELEAERVRNTTFIENAYREFTEEKLVNLNIAIIQTSQDYPYEDIKECVNTAGGNVPIYVGYNNILFALSSEAIEEINDSFNTNLNKDQIVKKVNEDLVEFIVNTEMTTFLRYMFSQEFLELKYYNDTELNIDYVIIAGGTESRNREKVNKVDLELIRRFKNNEIRVVGVEKSHIGYSHIPYYKNKGVSTIDNIDTIIGQLSLVLVLEGREGFFGIKDYAEKLAPIGNQ